jgi:signal peptidase I
VTTSGPTTSPVREAPTDVQRREVLRRVNRAGAPWRVFAEWAKSFIIAVALFLFVRTFFVEAFKIPSGSMEQTLLPGDFLLVNKLVFGAMVPFTHLRLPALRQPQRGDVIVFEYPRDRSRDYVKRLVGLPGDTLSMREGVLQRNGAALQEEYVTRIAPDLDPSEPDFRWQRDYLVRTAEAGPGAHPSRDNWGPLIVPAHSYFALGDNRDNSQDSRYWGFVPDSLIRGRPMFVYYSYALDPDRAFPWVTRIRWSRIGARVQ